MIERGIVEALHRAQASQDPKAITQAEALLGVLTAVKLDGFQDVAFPQDPKEAQPVEIKRFTQEEKELLEREGLTVIYPLEGRSINDQQSAGRKFWYVARSRDGSLTDLPSMSSEVAIDPRPNKFFLPNSNNKSLGQQLEMIAEYSHNLQRKLKTQTIEAIMGEAPDYVELALAHLDATRERLFGEKYGYNYARTKTPTVESNVALVGNFIADSGLNVDHWFRASGDDHVFASPLVVPKS